MGAEPARKYPPPDMTDAARLLISCPDRHGLVAAVTSFLAEREANVTDAQQHATAPEGGTFFMRLAFRIDGLDANRAGFEEAFRRSVARHYEMDYRIHFLADRKRMVVLVSKYDHALLELLWRQRAGDLDVDIPLVISNHDDLRHTVEGFGIPYHHLPVTRATKPEQERRIAELVGEAEVIVLARYMQILSAGLVERLAGRVINIHHSFLPAFVGANPYRHAYNRGVKLIGATAHFVTADLDEGPIIEQDVRRVSHRHEVPHMMRIGREVERAVLAKAVEAFVDDRVLTYGNKTVVFD